MWCSYRDNDRLDMVSLPSEIFYATYQQHVHAEPTRIEAWLENYRPLLSQCKSRRAEARRSGDVDDDSSCLSAISIDTVSIAEEDLVLG